MFSTTKITSPQNPRIKAVCELQEKSRERRKQGLFVIEGRREITMAIDAGYTIETLFYCDEMNDAQEFATHFGNEKTSTPLSENVFKKIAYRENSDGLLALARMRNNKLEELKLSKNPFIIVLEAVEKPGNLGAILRTSDAIKADAVIVCEPLTDIYNPNVVRSSLGCLFTQQIAVCKSEEAVKWLHDKAITTYAAELNASQWYHETDLSKPCAIVMGTEADGLSSFWLQHANARIKIPMRGKVDSLNVSVSTAVLAFEAMRQRDFKN